MILSILAAAGIGFASGVASGAFGIGGALLSTPGIRWAFATPPLIAVGTTLPVIIPTAVTGLLTYVRNRFVDLRSAAVAAAAGGTFAIVGAFTTKYVSGEALLIATAALIFVLSLRMLPRKGRVLRPPRLDASVPLLLVVGAASGFVSGLLGVGGGIILVPVLTVGFRFPVKTALGTSLAVVAAQAVPGTVTHALLGHIDWALAGGLVVGVVPGARLGSRLAVAASDERLRVVVALAMAALALAFGATEVRALLR